ncbi:ParB/RepB/Spo0J family partition protein [Yoonia sp. 2307UL14-13]|uniref:ParB/RepB/Spo0J family partition protein n=1 Tax=Yoonia sp. 2307UL14-13 TaxID=3126506 RepID=UPI0030A26829
MNKQTDIATFNETAHRDQLSVPLADLTLSPLNPRQNVSEEDIASMADSIRTISLIQPLGAHLTDGRYEIVVGGRRLRALKRLAGESLESQYAPIIVAKDEAEARAWAAAENIARIALHPADEVNAYAQMAESGADMEMIASAFGVTKRHVAGRMKLAQLPALILDALRADDITLDVAAAYAICTDPERITQTYQLLSGTHAGANPDAIKRRLMQDRASGEHRLARFVGRARYEEAGGTITEDLFGEDLYFDDPALLTELAEARLAAECVSIESEGWKWVEGDFDTLDWTAMQRFGRTYPESVILEEAEEDRYHALLEKIEDGEATPEDEAAFADLEAQLAVETYTDEQKVHAGVFVAVTHNGTLQVTRGLVRPEDRAEAAKAGVCATPHGNTQKNKPQGPYSAALMRDMAAIRTCAVQTALLQKPELALDLLTFALSEWVMVDHLPVGVTGKEANGMPEQDDGLTVDERLTAAEYRTPLHGADAAEAFVAFRAKSRKQRNAILTETVAKLVSVGLALKASNPLAELIATLCEADIRKVWTPTTSFLDRLKSAQLDDVLSDITGAPVSRSFAKSSKRDKVARLHALFNNPVDQRGLAPEAKARLAAWVPEGMQIAPAAPKQTAKNAA